jgi:hypothetical protein
MKEKDILLDFKDHQLIMYTEKDNDTYGPVITGAASVHEFLPDLYEKWKRMELTILQKIINGELSLVYYYMMIEELTPFELAKRIGISRSKVEKHFHPKHFEKASLNTVRKYAEVFNIPVANLFQIISTKEDGLWKKHSAAMSDEVRSHQISQQKTKNPFVVFTKTEEKES